MLVATALTAGTVDASQLLALASPCSSPQRGVGTRGRQLQRDLQRPGPGPGTCDVPGGGETRTSDESAQHAIWRRQGLNYIGDHVDSPGRLRVSALRVMASRKDPHRAQDPRYTMTFGSWSRWSPI